MSREHVGQIAVRRIVIVLDVAPETDDVEQDVVQMCQPRLQIASVNAVVHGIAQLTNRGLGFFDVGARPLVLGNGERGAKQAPRRFYMRQLASEGVVGG